MPECSARLVYRAEYQAYDFGPQHPLRPERFRCSFDLFASLGIAARPSEQLQAPPASLDELCLAHARAYVYAVKSMDAFADDPLLDDEASRWAWAAATRPRSSACTRRRRRLPVVR